jgi:hypothetical protein
MLDEPLDPQLAAALGHYRDWCEGTRRGRRDAERLPETLFQYTNGAGLKGIVETGQIWLTNIFDLNDPSEFLHGVQYASEYLQEISARNEDLAVSAFCDVMLGSLSPPYGGLGVFVASFSEAGDDLGQWRAYASNGGGYALGVSSAVFPQSESMDIIPNCGVAMGRVNYREESIRAWQRECVDRAITTLQEIEKILPEKVKAQKAKLLFELSFQLAAPIFWNSLTTKHSAYENEREYRLILLGALDNLNPYIQTRLKGDHIVPYVAVPLDVDKQGNRLTVRVGPTANAGAELGVEVLLRTNNINPEGRLSRSSIPYRAA